MASRGKAKRVNARPLQSKEIQMHRYFANPDTEISDEAAQALGSRFMALSESGAVSAARVVDDARPETSPTHPYFEWNDQAAAERWRESQATFYLENIVIIPDEALEPIDASDIEACDDADSYTLPSRDIPREGEEVVNRARRELESWQQRYGQIYELRPAMPWVREALGALGSLVRLKTAGL
jgi:hypothetical protein